MVNGVWRSCGALVFFLVSFVVFGVVLWGWLGRRWIRVGGSCDVY